MQRLIPTSAGALLATLALAAPAAAQSPDVVIAEVYGGGGNSGATFQHDFVELFNRGTAGVPLDGKSVQYASATGTGTFAGNSPVELSGAIEPGQRVLIRLAGGANGAPLPEADITAGAPNLSASGGKVALVDQADGLACNGGSDPCTAEEEALIRDLVGYGSADYFETAPAPAGSNTTSIRRNGEGCDDTDDNAADFASSPPDPDNRESERTPCGGPPGDEAPRVVSTTPPNGASDVPRDAGATVTFSEPVDAGQGSFTFTCNGQAVPFTVSANAEGTTYTLDPGGQLPEGAECTVTTLAAGVSDRDGDDPPDNPSSNHSFSFSTTGVGGLRIHDIQGRAHRSPFERTLVAGVPGVITAVRSNGFYFQDPQPDRDKRTSEGLFVFTGDEPAANLQPNTAVTVGGRVTEFRPGGAASANLTTTEITNPTVAPAGTGAILPTVVGKGGRKPPTEVIDDDTPDPQRDDPPLVTGDVEQGSTFDPDEDGIDFYESLEGMLTQVNKAQAVQPTNRFGEIPVLADRGAGATNRTPRWSIVARAVDFSLPQDYRLGDFNPERIFLDDEISRPAPVLDTRDTLDAPVRAVVDYSFGNFKFEVLDWPGVRDGRLRPETTKRQKSKELSVATYNVENLDPGDGARFEAIARQIARNMRAPDIIAIVEAQDNNGPAAGDSNADVTFTRLVEAIDAVGPEYDYRQIDPVNNQDGGEPNGNIRVGFVFRPDRVDFVDRPGGTAVNSTEDDPSRGGAQLTFSPGRIDPNNPVWEDSRKPLAGEFRFRGETVFVVANHFASKGGDEPLFGRFQEPRRPSEVQRRGGTQPDRPDRGQAGVVNAWVEDLLEADPRANVVVAGDFNDFDFSETLRVLERGRETSRRAELVNLWRLLPARERYSYIFEGNAQTLDHVLVSPSLLRRKARLDGVHINAEFSEQVSDHDPLVARLQVEEDSD